MSPSSSRPLILIADDIRDTREMYALYLSMVGYAVETAADGREAVVKVVTLRPDLIVMDLHMPGVDGWRAMREIRSDTKLATAPIIVLTGHDFKRSFSVDFEYHARQTSEGMSRSVLNLRTV